MYPDFLCIGAQKAGTTWLHHNLKQHPEIWLPPVKEIHYLDHKPPRLFKRLFGKPTHLSEARRHLMSTILSFPGHASVDDIKWAFRYSMGYRDDLWYQSLFPDAIGKRTGEVCPGYARLNREQVSSVHSKMPNLQIIYLLRNPVERAWSTTVMHFNKPKYGGIDKASESEIVAHFRDQRTEKHSNYIANLDIWEYFYKDRLYVGFFEQLQTDPTAFLANILQFLGVSSSDGIIPEDVGVRRNKGTTSSIPEKYLPVLRDLYSDQIHLLDKKFNNVYTNSWVESIR